MVPYFDAYLQEKFNPQILHVFFIIFFNVLKFTLGIFL